MKKTALALLFAILSVSAFSQKGDLSVGVKGGYVLSTAYLPFNSILYGADVAYHLSDQFEVAFTGLLNPNITRKDQNDKLAVYSANLDLRLYLVHFQNLATGPFLGGQYYIVNNSTNSVYNSKALGLNIGWHLRINLTDNLKLNGGWRWVNAKSKDRNHWWDSSTNDISNHLFYLGLSYTFESK